MIQVRHFVAVMPRHDHMNRFIRHPSLRGYKGRSGFCTVNLKPVDDRRIGLPLGWRVKRYRNNARGFPAKALRSDTPKLSIAMLATLEHQSAADSRRDRYDYDSKARWESRRSSQPVCVAGNSYRIHHPGQDAAVRANPEAFNGLGREDESPPILPRRNPNVARRGQGRSRPVWMTIRAMLD